METLTVFLICIVCALALLMLSIGVIILYIRIRSGFRQFRNTRPKQLVS